MFLKKLWLTFSILFAGLFLLSSSVFAGSGSSNGSSFCACCAEPGEYLIWTGKPDKYVVDTLAEMKYDQAAYLYLTEAGFEGMVKGLKGIEKEFEASESWVASPGEFSLTNAFAARTWKFNFKTKSGKSGVLTLPVPTQMVQYKVDIHDGKSFGGGGPALYKEWRFKGVVQSGSGIFQPDIIKPTTYFLVLQGRGNGCDNAEDFRFWRLEIEGKKAKYAFFGELSSGRKFPGDEDDDEEETEQQ